ncbi:hypothetical protein ABBQ32_008786 [Trebouxia sp. C0010 RCD-2024]
MSNSRGLRRALSPKRSLRLESQGSEGSGLNRLSFTGSRKRTRKHSKLQTTGAAHDIDPQAFLEEWKITPQEEEKRLADLRALLDKEGVLRPQFDMYMQRRFLRARNHDVQKAKAMFMAHVQWRKEFGADTLDEFVFHERDAIISLYPQGYHKTDKMGRPIYIQHLGQVNIKKIYEVTTEERMLKFHVQEYERCIQYIMPACSKVSGRHIEQTFAILDVKGVGIKQVSSVKQMLGKITSLDSNNYPEMLGKTCIINAPSGFGMIFGMVKPFLDVRTRAKVEVCPKDFLPSLLKYIDPENLPRYLGGTSDATLIDDAGPWNDPQIRAEIEEDIALRDRSSSQTMSVLPESPPAASSTSPLAASSTSPLAASSLSPLAASSMSPLAAMPMRSTAQAAAQPLSSNSTVSFSRGPEAAALPHVVPAPGLAVASTSLRTSPFAAHSHQLPFEADSVQFVDANEMDDASEYDDAMSQLGSMSMSSAFSDDEASPLNRSSGSPGRLTEGASTADVRLQEAHVGPGSDADALAAWKTGEAADATGYPHPSSLPGGYTKGRPILERVRELETKLPQLQQHVRNQNGGVHVRQPGQNPHSLVGRVEALEEAVEVLLLAQEQQVQNVKEEDHKTTCCQCCTIM